MANKSKQKRRLRKTIIRRQKELAQIRLDKNWKKYWVINGVLHGDA